VIPAVLPTSVPGYPADVGPAWSRGLRAAPRTLPGTTAARAGSGRPGALMDSDELRAELAGKGRAAAATQTYEANADRWWDAWTSRKVVRVASVVS
jgi:hypothetical protein